MQKRRSFLKKSIIAGTAISTQGILACNTKNETISDLKKMQNPQKELKISLAQWSLNRAFFGKQLDPNDFAKITRETYNIDAIEYVNQFYIDHATDDKFWFNLKKRAEDQNVKSLLIMVDDEGDLGNPNNKERDQAVTNHQKWINAAKLLGCHSIRVNAFGDGSKDDVRSALVDGMGKLSENAAKDNINVIIENHGLYSSDGKWVAGIIKEVNQSNFGTLPDFGNWCTNAKWGSTQNNKCDEVYNRYVGVADFLPYAKGVSAKSYNFNEDGEDSVIDYHKMLRLVKNSDYDGYIGIEYEGEILSEHEGIIATKALLETAWAAI